MKNIIGAGGSKSGGGAGYVSREESDTLQSDANAEILDLISEGPIEGLVNGLHSVYLDETPVVDEKGNPNFKGVHVEFREGTQFQDHVEGFASSQATTAVGIEVSAANPVVRTINNPQIDSVDIIISIPTMTKTDASGNLSGSSVVLKIEKNSNGGGWVQINNDEIRGKCVSKYQISYNVKLTGEAPHQLRVSRVTPDSNSVTLQDKIYWDAFVEIIDSKLTYPNSAYAALRVNAANFQSIPQRAYDVKLLKIKVPSNYDPLTRTYDGLWDGEFQVLWSDNPAWIYYDMATNERYGAGISEDMVDKWALYRAARYCDEWVDDGRGGKEPRFTANLYFQTQQDAYEVFKILTGLFRGFSYWRGGLLSVSFDAPSDPVMVFSGSNVIDGDFQYQGTAAKDRYTVALITWNDPANFFKQKVEYVEDHDAIVEQGVKKTQLISIGCTSQGQAHRLGRWILYISQNETETVTFRAGADASNLQLGDVFLVQDRMRAGKRMSGRVSAATAGIITIDDPNLVLDLMNDSFELQVMVPSGKMLKKPIQSKNGRQIVLVSDLDEVPHQHALWVITSNSLQAQSFRCVSVSEDRQQYTIVGLSHNPAKYDLIEKDLKLPDATISTLSLNPDTPKNLKVTETLYRSSGGVKTKATFSWEVAANASTYLPQYRKQNGNVVYLQETRTNEVEILDLDEDIYNFSVVASSAVGIKSQRASVEFEIRGKTIPPGQVQGFSMIPQSNMAYLSWELATDLDVLIDGKVRIRHSQKENPNWMDAVDVAILPGNSTRHTVPLVNGTYMAKFIDSSGNVSEEVAQVFTTAMEASKLNVIEVMTEHPAFAGIKQNMQVMPQYNNALVLMSSEMIDSVADIDSLGAIDFLGNVGPSGEYQTAKKDLGAVFTCRVTAKIAVKAYDVTDLIDSRTELIDTWADFDANTLDTVNVELLMVTTDDDPEDPDAVWQPPRRFLVGEYKFRGVYFIAKATTTKATHTVAIEELEFSIDVPDRTESQKGLVSLIGDYLQVTYEKPFMAVPVPGVTVYGDPAFVDIIERDEAGFKVRFVDSTGAQVVRTFDFIAVGYGRRVS